MAEIGDGEVSEEHVRLYNDRSNFSLELPPEGARLKVEKGKKETERPFSAHADYECSLIPTVHRLIFCTFE